MGAKPVEVHAVFRPAGTLSKLPFSTRRAGQASRLNSNRSGAFGNSAKEATCDELTETHYTRPAALRTGKKA